MKNIANKTDFNIEGIFEIIINHNIIKKQHHQDLNKKNFNHQDIIRHQQIRIQIMKIYIKKKDKCEKEVQNPHYHQQNQNHLKKINEKILIEEIIIFNIEIDEQGFSILLFNNKVIDFNTKVDDQDIIIISHFILEMILEGNLENIGIDKLILLKRVFYINTIIIFYNVI